MNILISLILVICATILPTTTWADWSGGLEGGSIIRDGESATRLRLRASLDERPLSHYVYAEWVRSDTSSYEIGYKPRYWFSNTVYGFGEGRIRIEDALSIDSDSLVLGGVGVQLITTEVQRLTFEAGVGYQQIDYTEESGIEELGEGVATLRGYASQVLSDLFKLELNADVFANPSSFESLLEAGVSLRLAQGAIKISHRIRRIDVDGFDAIDDTDTAVAFTVGF